MKKNPDLVKFGLNIRKIRLKEGLSQIDLAKQAGLSANYIGTLERGCQNPSLKTWSDWPRGLDARCRRPVGVSSEKEEAMNVMSVLKAEISRLARKEAKAIVSPVKKASATYRGLIAGLRKQVDALQKEVSSLKRAMPKADKVLEAKTEPEGRFWITGKGIKAMRKKTGLTQEKFGKLVGVSVPTVVNWEKANGKVEIRRKETMARLQGLKGKGKREVAEMLPKEAKEPKAKAKAKAKKKA